MRPNTSADTEWSVDDRCTNCDVARQLAPGLIGEADGKSVILHQPRNAAEDLLPHAAAYACHARSIRRADAPLEPALDPYPMRIEGPVFLCGHNSSQTAGANSYLLVRPCGNIMIDTPRWSEPLAARYERLGAVTDVLLTHRDHATHGRRYADRFGAPLWITKATSTRHPTPTR
ncbi:4Fe-4S domain-containing protein [Kibdelosporangium phytohabitans]|uniref:4Fe-4S domain-containing protein n=1 Tax=Kibdelosporangium phytohabitans TaxID=860235 RepID=UPI000A5FAEB2|nr:ferredoxin [Kibdelosporangium phytohabitans]MBE1465130.1 hypothetical protein [Kibdelosporangium phytohabitans]